MEEEIASFYGKDHDQLDGYFRKFQELKKKDYAQAKEFFKKFKFGLQRHIVWEEEILFPLFERKTGMKDFGPTFEMREEHRQIGQFLEALHEKVQQQNPESDQEEDLLWNTLKQHNHKEENVLYPEIDQQASVAERKEVFRSMQDLPEERYKTCCQGHAH